MRLYKSTKEVVVFGSADTHGCEHLTQTLNCADDVLGMVQGVNMMRRGNFATEPSIRGMSAGQIALTIDGMKMHSACVDRMDPISAYVEIENMHRLEVNKGGSELSTGQTLGGSMNFITEKATTALPFFLRAETAYESVSQLQRLRAETNIAGEHLALRATASFKKSGDYNAGNAKRINNSSYTKENALLSGTWNMASRQSLGALVIVDGAHDIGYPALIMDARKTLSTIAAIDYKAEQLSQLLSSFSVKLYGNTVEHTMDDYSRSNQEIEQRIVMPGMYMPMAGNSTTIGSIINAAHYGETSLLKATIDISSLRANAVMDMLPLNGSAPMHLDNLGDVRLHTVGMVVEYAFPQSDKLYCSLQGRMDYTWRRIANTTTKNVLESYWEGANSDTDYLLTSINTNVRYKADETTTLVLTLARAMRAPTQIENFGYYLYNPMDNSLYIGNPGLRPEIAWQADAGCEYNDEGLSLRSSLFFYYINNYIAGVTFQEEDSTNQFFKQAFRKYQNTGDAIVRGIELNARYQLTKPLQLRAQFRWQAGQSVGYNEPLPFMPPAEADIRLYYRAESWWCEPGLRLVAAQNSISQHILHEDSTPGFAVADLRFGWNVAEHFQLKTGIENLFDKLYYEHFAINNLPSRGRNFYASLSYTW